MQRPPTVRPRERGSMTQAAERAGASAAKAVAIVQSSYIPWKGFFDLVNLVDELVLYDDRQFTRRDWRNRNRIKTAQGTIWLTIPVRSKGKYESAIDEIETDGREWRERHWRTLAHSYMHAAHFEEYADRFEELYLRRNEHLLSEVNRSFIEAVCDVLGIRTKLTSSREYAATGSKTERLVDLCRQAGATAYLSGPTARAYLDETLFDECGITVAYMDYEGYPVYPQLHGEFDHHVSILDLLFCTGRDARTYMKSFDEAR
jgi:hypothetical protein